MQLWELLLLWMKWPLLPRIWEETNRRPLSPVFTFKPLSNCCFYSVFSWAASLDFKSIIHTASVWFLGIWFLCHSEDLHCFTIFIHLAGKSLNSQRSFPKLASAPEECESNSRKPFTSCPASSQASRVQGHEGTTTQHSIYKGCTVGCPKKNTFLK